MSKLNINKSSFNFFKNNKIKYFAITSVLIASLSMCSPIKNQEKIVKKEYFKYIQNNISNIKIIKDYTNNCYNITENIDEENKRNKSNQYIHYSITFEQAEELNITEILDKNTEAELKKEMVLN